MAVRVAEPDAALAAFEESIALTRQGSSDVVLAPSLVFMATLQADRGEGRAALVRIREALRHCLDCGDRPSLCGTLDIVAEILGSDGRDEFAARCAAIATASDWRFLSGPALERHTRTLDRSRARLDAQTLEGIRARASAMSPEDLAVEIIAELDALIAAEAETSGEEPATTLP